MFWFLIEHHALNISLKNRNDEVQKELLMSAGNLISIVHVSNLYIPAVSCHTFVAAVFFVPVFTLYSQVVAAGSYTHTP